MDPTSARGESSVCGYEPSDPNDCTQRHAGPEARARIVAVWSLAFYGRIPDLVSPRRTCAGGLLTTSSFASGGRLGQPDTQILYGDDRLETRHDDRFFGGRFGLEWLSNDQSWGLEARAFFLERDSTHFEATSDGSTLLAIPYTNALTGQPASEIIAGPTAAGLRNGGFVGYSRIELYGEEGNVVIPLAGSPNLNCELLVGSRFLQMRDRVDLTATGWLLPEQTTLYGLEDHVRVHNAFYGGQVGLQGDYCLGRWVLNFRGTVALGGDDQQVQAYGASLYQTPTERIVQPYGLAVQPSNTGSFSHSAVDFVSEVGVNLGYRLTDALTLFVGYTFLYWNNPLRAGDQLDMFIAPAGSTSSGPQSYPIIPFKSDNFWAQGVSVALDFRW